jgi:endoglucanase Acf2
MAPNVTTNNYGSIQEHPDIDIDIETSEMSVMDSPKRNTKFISKNRLLIISASIIGIVSLFLLRITSLNKGQSGGNNKDPANDRTTVDDDYSDPVILPLLAAPLSILSPEDDVGLPGIDRAADALPSPIWGETKIGSLPLPTNSWYQNLVSHQAADTPNESTKAYTVPYIIDTAPTNHLAGVRIHWPVMQANEKNMQMVYDASNGLSLGTKQTYKSETTSETTSTTTTTTPHSSSHYTVDQDEELSLLGVSLTWGENNSMRSPIVRGMPYTTMQYRNGALPSLASGNSPANPPLMDGTTELMCGLLMDGNGATTTRTTKGTMIGTAKKEVLLHFKSSDFTWAVFFSRPVQLQCSQVAESEFGTVPGEAGAISDVMFELNVVQYEQQDDDDDEEPLTVRVALIDQCTSGKSDIHRNCLPENQMKDKEGYLTLLRQGAHLFPKTPKVGFDYDVSDEKEGGNNKDNQALVTFDWDTQTFAKDGPHDDFGDMVMFALPHHQDQLQGTMSDAVTEACVRSFHGNACLVKGSTWTLVEKLGNPQSFVSARPPAPWAISALAQAVSTDIRYRLSDDLMRGAADTYFSGKIMARLGRVIEIAVELKQLAESSSKQVPAMYTDTDTESYALAVQAAKEVTLPTDVEIETAIEQVKKGVQIWVNGKGEAPYVYDRSWGGLVNCGCDYKGMGDRGSCVNIFPDCPALKDVNVDFGNGYYNDHHYHYGYHLYAAAVAAKHDPEWGKTYFDEVLLYVRDIANPSPDDEFFTQFRQKDWFLGSSWASGIVSGENSPHGRNEESSSEAISAYEAMALYGAVMVSIFIDSSLGVN